MKIVRFNVTFLNEEGKLEMIGSAAYSGKYPHHTILSVGRYILKPDTEPPLSPFKKTNKPRYILTHDRDATEEEKRAILKLVEDTLFPPGADHGKSST